MSISKRSRRALEALAFILALLVLGLALRLGLPSLVTGGRQDAGPGSGSGAGGQGDGKPVVAVSIFPLADLVRRIAGQRVEVSTILPPGSSPHQYEPGPEDARRLDAADLVILVGGGLEPFAARLASVLAPGAERLELVSRLPRSVMLRPGGASSTASSSPDPHFWLDPVLVRDHVLPILVGALAGLCPEGTAHFEVSSRTLESELDELDRWISDQLAGLGGYGMITFHPAWRYFCRRYGLETWSIEQAPGQEPSPRWLAELAEIAVQQGIVTLFVEPQATASSLPALVTRAGGRVVILDPLGGEGLAGYASYLELMRTNVSAIEQGLR